MEAKINGVSPKEGWFILTNFDKLEVAISAYKRRFDIEEMFRDFKKGGYNLEETNVTGERFISLVLLIAIAYSAATIQCQQIKAREEDRSISNFVVRIVSKAVEEREQQNPPQ